MPEKLSHLCKQPSPLRVGTYKRLLNPIPQFKRIAFLIMLHFDIPVCHYENQAGSKLVTTWKTSKHSLSRKLVTSVRARRKPIGEYEKIEHGRSKQVLKTIFCNHLGKFSQTCTQTKH